MQKVDFSFTEHRKIPLYKILNIYYISRYGTECI